MPVEILMAMAATAWALGWRYTSALLLLGFHALLRPAEMTTLHRMHLPFDSGERIWRGIVFILCPKTRNVGARIQGVMILDKKIAILAERPVGLAPAAHCLVRWRPSRLFA